MPPSRALRERRAESSFSAANDYVFATRLGTPPMHRNVTRRGFEKAVENAGLNAEGKPRFRWHDQRHTFVSMLINAGADITYVSRQAGHSSIRETLDTYQHLLDRNAHAERARDALEARFAGIAELPDDPEDEGAEVIELAARR